MGRPTGFLEFPREGPGAALPARAGEGLGGVPPRRPGGAPQAPGRPLHGLRDAVLPHRQAHRRDGLGLPDQQPHPRLERPRLPRAVARGGDPPPPDEQLPRVHGPRLPRPVRGLLHARAQRRRGDDQGDRVRHRGPRLRRGVGLAGAAGDAHGQARGGRRVGAGGPRLRRAAQQGGAHGHRLRARRPGRRPPDVRHPEHEARQAARRAARAAHGERGHPLRDRASRSGGTSRPRASSTEYDAAVLCIGATVARDLPVEGREPLRDPPRDGVPPREHAEPPRLGARRRPASSRPQGKNVVVIGGGDTGTDCVGTALRHGAASVVQLEILARPPDRRAPDNPWPQWPKIYRLDYGQEEAAALQGADPRRYSVQTKRFVGDAEGRVREVHTVEVEWRKGPDGRPQIHEMPGDRAGRPGRARPPRARLPRSRAPGAGRRSSGSGSTSGGTSSPTARR